MKKGDWVLLTKDDNPTIVANIEDNIVNSIRNTTCTKKLL